MKASRFALGFTFVMVLFGCSSTTVMDRQSDIGDTRLARPKRIVVYDFAATAADVPAWAAPAARYNEPSTPPPAEQVAAGRKLGAEVSKQLAAEIRAMGLPAEEDDDGAPPRIGDIAFVGFFESVDKGSAVERLALGFGTGAADLKTRVEGFEMTAAGPRFLGAEDIDSGGGKSPGLIVPLAVTIATANPIGLAVGGVAKVGMEASGMDTIEGAARRTAKQIAAQLQVIFEKQGWI